MELAPLQNRKTMSAAASMWVRTESARTTEPAMYMAAMLLRSLLLPLRSSSPGILVMREVMREVTRDRRHILVDIPVDIPEARQAACQA